LYAFDAADGKILWSSVRGDGFFSSPAVAKGVVYIGSTSNAVFAYGATTGKLLWDYNMRDNTVESSPAVVNGVVYVGSDDGNVYALNADNGTKIWNHTISSAIGWNYFYETPEAIGSSPAVANNIVYIASDDGNIYALNAANGNKLWNYTINSSTLTIRQPWPPFVSSPAVEDGAVYVGSGDNIYALNATSGNELWSYATDGWVESSPAVVNGVVYLGTDNGSVYALGSPSIPEFSSLDICLPVLIAVTAATLFTWEKRKKNKNH
jgi:outer membrane protein assembly factor BamB